MWYNALTMDIVLFFQSTAQKSWRMKLAGVHRFARGQNWFVQVVDRLSSPSRVRGMIDEWRPVGCMVDRAQSRGAAPDKMFQGVPTVYLDQNAAHPSAEHPNLLHDSAAEAAIAGGELLRLGFDNYAYLETGQSLEWDAKRLERFRADVDAAGRRLTVLTRRMLSRSISAIPRPFGLLAANDLLAIDAYNAAMAAGLSIPDDMAVAGIDNDELYCESVSPGITSVEPDFEGAGYRLAAMLKDEIDFVKSGKTRASPPLQTYGPLRLVSRGSTAPAKTTGPAVRRALEYIRRHACEETIRIDDVLREMKCSRRMATMKFKKETGLTILNAIQEQRMKRVDDLLANTTLPIATVVAQCGYKSDAFVKRMFLERHGTTMRDYRRQAHDASDKTQA